MRKNPAAPLGLAATFLLVAFSACSAPADEMPEVTLRPAFPNLRFERPLFLTAPPTDGDRLFVLEQNGRVSFFENRRDVEQRQTAIDLDVGRRHNEEGLLGMAFHPDFGENRLLFLHYTHPEKPRRNVLARFRMNEEATRIDESSKKVVMTVGQPWGNHNGGMIAFGPEDYLYLALGDGGAGGDPRNNGQDRSTLLGSILRLDVDRSSEDKAYAVPEDNPFVDHAEARGEIWAWGLRNVWRFSFDRKTGALWAGDVGQNKWEEIDLVRKGGNYGWNIREGKHWFDRRPHDTELMDPVVDHPRNEAASITGGYVYRGDALPALEGAYVYADYVRGTIWALWHEEGTVQQHRVIGEVPRPASFGTDRAGEIYATCFDGRIYKLSPR